MQFLLFWTMPAMPYILQEKVLYLQQMNTKANQACRKESGYYIYSDSWVQCILALTAMHMMSNVFRIVMPCSSKRKQRFGEIFRLHIHGVRVS
jgi:hypothetical protein